MLLASVLNHSIFASGDIGCAIVRIWRKLKVKTTHPGSPILTLLWCTIVNRALGDDWFNAMSVGGRFVQLWLVRILRSTISSCYCPFNLELLLSIRVRRLLIRQDWRILECYAGVMLSRGCRSLNKLFVLPLVSSIHDCGCLTLGLAIMELFERIR